MDGPETSKITDRPHENNIKVLFLIVSRIEGEYKRIDMNTEVNYVYREKNRHGNDHTERI